MLVADTPVSVMPTPIADRCQRTGKLGGVADADADAGAVPPANSLNQFWKGTAMTIPAGRIRRVIHVRMLQFDEVLAAVFSPLLFTSSPSEVDAKMRAFLALCALGQLPLVYESGLDVPRSLFQSSRPPFSPARRAAFPEAWNDKIASANLPAIIFFMTAPNWLGHNQLRAGRTR